MALVKFLITLTCECWHVGLKAVGYVDPQRFTRAVVCGREVFRATLGQVAVHFAQCVIEVAVVRRHVLVHGPALNGARAGQRLHHNAGGSHCGSLRLSRPGAA